MRQVDRVLSPYVFVAILAAAAIGQGCGASNGGTDVGDNASTTVNKSKDGGSGSSSASGSGAGTGDDAAIGDTGSSNGSGDDASSGSSSDDSGSSSGTSRDSGIGAHDPSGSNPTKLPSVNGTCPTFAASSGGALTITAGSGTISAAVWAGAKTGGPLILYWHGTGSSPGGEVPISFDTAAVTAAGGMIVGFTANSRTGATSGNTGDNVWYQSDGAFADQVVACAIKANRIDPRHIHTAGYSAGGLQTVWMWYARSGYLASVISYSGGDGIINRVALQDPAHLPAAIAAHGAPGSDALGLDFAMSSVTWEGAIKTAGGFSIDCNDGGGHIDFFTKRAPPLKPVSLKFFEDHPFGVKPEPYTSLPSGFPSYCKID